MKSNKYTIDRFEGDLAVLLLRDDETIVKVISNEELGNLYNEGDILEITFDKYDRVESVYYLKDETEYARWKALELLKKLKNK
ncbi:hypothetical protein GCM10009865_22250 [Aeromicrobium ponti]|uniref:DUF3006 family protein n=1 Tax=Cytobacillus oceanisediminis TaxID=665099 RepID=A0A562JWC0_9BACI|nr:DUF3006 domain-containing protein [Cytobacillus oceanisediminis]TWH87492.1 Protein of unknown function (DUF3006) [Cytobacillus oceanisediminis]